MQMLDSRGDGGGYAPAQAPQAQSAAPAKPQQTTAPAMVDDNFDDDIPF